KLRGRYAALSIAAVVIAVGIPLWWKTTETYRAWLPYSHINELGSLQLQLSMEVEVVFSRGTLTPEQQKKVPLTQTREQQHHVDEADFSLYKLSESPCGSVVVYVIPETSVLLPEVGQGGELKAVLSALDPEIEQVVRTMSFSHEDIMAALSDRIRMGRLSKESLADSMRSFKSSPGYEITFSLLNPDPQSHNLHWDIEGAIHTYIQPLLDKLAPVANHSVDSQILYYAVLGVNPRFDNSVSAFTLSADSLAHVINPVEARLGSNAASSNPVLNFLLFVPDAHHSPLFIQDHSKRVVDSNAFHSPRWGGIMVYNVNDRYGQEAEFPVHIDIDMAHVMGVFLAQLRLMLGVQSAHPPPGFLLQSPGSAGLTDWELDRLQWSRTVENVATASTSITSLAQLLDQIGNIVINDNIAQ
ncbi:GPI transamidase component PIG-S-like, partial [Scleropages formosus]